MCGFPVDKGAGSPFRKKPLAFHCRVASLGGGRGEGGGEVRPIHSDGPGVRASFKCRKLSPMASGFFPLNGFLQFPHP